jgi:hypothetical protein
MPFFRPYDESASSRRRAGDRPPGRLPRALSMTLIGAVVATGAVVAPVVVAPPAQATVWTNYVDTWSKAFNTTLSVAAKVKKWESTFGAAFLSGTGALAFAAPLLTLLFQPDTGPSLSDVMDKLGDIENELASMNQTLQQIESEVRQTDVDTLMGTCRVETSALTDLLTRVETAQSEYDDMSSKLAHIDDVGDVQDLQIRTNSFIRTVFGSANLGQTYLDSTDMGQAIDKAHNLLISTGGSQGVIQSCGDAYLAQYKSAAIDAASAKTSDAASSTQWLDDRTYYEPEQELVMFWQTVSAQGLYLLQQASYLQAVVGYQQAGGTLTPDQATQACTSVAKGSGAYALCDSISTFTNGYYTKVAQEWQQAGVPYTDDSVVLSMGTDITGLGAPDGSAIPSTLWARDPNSVALVAGSTTTPYAGYNGWSSASSAQWKGLAYGYIVSHPQQAPTPVPPLQTYPKGASPFVPPGVAPFAPFDLLATMGKATQADGKTPQFSQTDRPFWIPGESATLDLKYGTDGLVPTGVTGGFAFPPSVSTPGTSADVTGAGRQFRAGYAGSALTVNCMVLPVDGVLCGDQTVGSWWVARERTKYDVVSANIFTGNYTAAASWTVTPSSPLVRPLTLAGRNAGCWNQAVCLIPPNTAGSVRPSWVQWFPSDVVSTTDAWSQSTGQQAWPALAVPTGTGCRTTWNVPSVCGPAMSTWVTANVPDLTVPLPSPTSAPAVVLSGDGSAVCEPPGWDSLTGSHGGALTYGNVTWSAVAEDGTSVAVDKPWDAPVSVADDILPLTKGKTTPSSLSLACTVSAHFAGEANVVTAPSPAVAATVQGGAWVVGAKRAPRVTRQPQSVTVDDGGDAKLSVTAVVPEDGSATDGGEGADTLATPTPAPDAPLGLGAGGGGAGHVSLSRASAATPAADPPVDQPATVVWQKRENGGDRWADLPLPATTSVTPDGGPEAIAQADVTSELPLRDLVADDHGDEYRAVITLADGTQVVSDPATISMTSVTKPWLPVLVGAGVLVVALAAVLGLLEAIRRRRSAA